jgi:hypothetical protein
MRNGYRLLIALACAWVAYEAIVAEIDRAPFLTPEYGFLWLSSGLFLLNHVFSVAFGGASLIALVVWCFAPRAVAWLAKGHGES